MRGDGAWLWIKDRVGGGGCCRINHIISLGILGMTGGVWGK